VPTLEKITGIDITVGLPIMCSKDVRQMAPFNDTRPTGKASA